MNDQVHVTNIDYTYLEETVRAQSCDQATVMNLSLLEETARNEERSSVCLRDPDETVRALCQSLVTRRNARDALDFAPSQLIVKSTLINVT